MKQIKKTHLGCRLLSILPMAGILAAGLGVAAPAYAGPIKINPAPAKHQPKRHISTHRRPDLQVRVWVDKHSVHQNADHTYNFTIRGELKNVGKASYISRRNQQVLFLHEVGKSHHITDWHFSDLKRGAVMKVHVPIKNHPGGEFVPAYELVLSFDPDIYNDKNPANDDRNRRNNQATVSSKAISTAFARASGGVRGVHIRPIGVRLGKPALTAAVKSSCPNLKPISFKIIGKKVPLIGRRKKGLYKLRLKGIVKNVGDDMRVPSGGRPEIINIVEYRTGGVGNREIKHREVRNLGGGHQVMISALTEPLSLSTKLKFLPQYMLVAASFDLDKACSKSSGPHSLLITRQMIRSALQH